MAYRFYVYVVHACEAIWYALERCLLHWLIWYALERYLLHWLIDPNICVAYMPLFQRIDGICRMEIMLWADMDAYGDYDGYALMPSTHGLPFSWEDVLYDRDIYEFVQAYFLKNEDSYVCGISTYVWDMPHCDLAMVLDDHGHELQAGFHEVFEESKRRLWCLYQGWVFDPGIQWLIPSCIHGFVLDGVQLWIIRASTFLLFYAMIQIYMGCGRFYLFYY